MRISIRKYDKKIEEGSQIVISHRLYTPGCQGIRKRVLGEDLSRIFIAFIDGTPIGCLTIDKYPTKVGESPYNIVNTWIKPAYRGYKIGKKLLLKAEKLSEHPLAGYASKKGEYFYNSNNIKAIKY